jgi:anti-sigma regulatory factor (Ser/Thr protein kinase)
MSFVYTTNLSEVRALAEKQARAVGLPEDRVTDFVIAVSEIAGNTVRHAHSAGSIDIWQEDGEILCELRDAGVIADPLAGTQPPPADATGGHGLWLVYQVCDRVELHSDANGTVIRLHMSVPDGAGRGHPR